MATALEFFIEQLPDDEPDWDGSESFSYLYRRSFPPLVDYCRRQLHGAADAEDVAQEAFSHAWASWNRYSSARPFWPWVATIARRLCIDHHRRAGRAETHRDAAITGLSTAPTRSPEEIVESSEEHRLGLLALKALPPAQQRVIGLRDLDGWSYEDIAAFEGVTVESVRGSLRRARVALRHAYSRLAGSAPALIFLAGFRGIRDRIVGAAVRAQRAAFFGPATIASAGDVVAGMVALAIVLTGAPAAAPGVHRSSAPVTPASRPASVLGNSSEAAAPAAATTDRTGTGSAATPAAPAPPARPAPTAPAGPSVRVPSSAPSLSVIPV